MSKLIVDQKSITTLFSNKKADFDTGFFYRIFEIE